MVKLELFRNKPIVRQFPTRPMVYLDHWAIRKISSNNKIKIRFNRLLKEKNGTLAISLINFMEFSKVEDEKHRASFEKLIEMIFPNIFFLQFEPFSVIKGEIKSPPSLKYINDIDLLKLCEDRLQNLSNKFNAKDLVNDFFDSKISSMVEQLKLVFKEQVQRMKDEVEQDNRKKHNVLRPISRFQKSAKSHIILRELLRPFVADLRRKPDLNDAFDFYHATIPLSYCNIVALDSKWCSHANQAQRRIQVFNSPIRLAQTCKSVDSLLKFLETN